MGTRKIRPLILESNIARRMDFALFMVAALENDELIHEAPAIVGCKAPLALVHAGDARYRLATDGRRRPMSSSYNPHIDASDADVTDGAFTRRYGAAPAVPRADP